MTPIDLVAVFEGDEPPRMALERDLLVLALVQFRLPQLSHLQTKEGQERAIASAAESLSTQYPLFEQREGLEVVVTGRGAEAKSAPPVALLSSRMHEWKVSVASDAVSLFTANYTGRDDFLERARGVAEAVGVAFRPPHFARVGVRLLNRLHSDDLDDLAGVLCPALSAGTQIELPEGVSQRVGMTEWAFDMPGAQVFKARFGYLPAGAQLDPSVPAVDARTWVLDIDSWAHEVSTEGDQVMERVSALASLDHKFFRWAIDEGAVLDKFGGHYEDGDGPE